MHKFCSMPLHLRRATTEPAGESGVQLFVGIELEAYGYKAVSM